MSPLAWVAVVSIIGAALFMMAGYLAGKRALPTAVGDSSGRSTAVEAELQAALSQQGKVEQRNKALVADGARLEGELQQLRAGAAGQGGEAAKQLASCQAELEGMRPQVAEAVQLRRSVEERDGQLSRAKDELAAQRAENKQLKDGGGLGQTMAMNTPDVDPRELQKAKQAAEVAEQTARNMTTAKKASDAELAKQAKELKEHERVLASMKTKLSAAEKAAGASKAGASASRDKKVAELDRALASRDQMLKDARKKSAAKDSELAKLKKSAQEAEASVKQLAQDLEAAKLLKLNTTDDVASVPSMASMASLKTGQGLGKIADLQTRLDDAQQKLAQLPAPQEYRTIVKKLEAGERDAGKLRATISDHESALKRANEDLGPLRKMEEHYKQVVMDLEVVQRKAAASDQHLQSSLTLKQEQEETSKRQTEMSDEVEKLAEERRDLAAQLEVASHKVTQLAELREENVRLKDEAEQALKTARELEQAKRELKLAKAAQIAGGAPPEAPSMPPETDIRSEAGDGVGVVKTKTGVGTRTEGVSAIVNKLVADVSKNSQMRSLAVADASGLLVEGAGDYCDELAAIGPLMVDLGTRLGQILPLADTRHIRVSDALTVSVTATPALTDSNLTLITLSAGESAAQAEAEQIIAPYRVVEVVGAADVTT